MNRTGAVITVLGATCVAAAVVWHSLRAADAADAAPAPAAVAPVRITAAPPAISADVRAPDTAIPAAALARWKADAVGADAHQRAMAIAALAAAPIEDALPTLAGVLDTGEPADRLAALRALRTLAQRGDRDGRIRDAVRRAVYHGDTEEFTRAAQSTLDEIEIGADHGAG